MALKMSLKYGDIFLARKLNSQFLNVVERNDKCLSIDKHPYLGVEIVMYLLAIMII